MFAARQKRKSQSQASPNVPGGWPDVPANHPARQAVQHLSYEGIVEGVRRGDFDGARAMTRYEFAVVLDRLLSGAVGCGPAKP